MALLRDCSPYLLFILCSLQLLGVNCVHEPGSSSLDDIIIEYVNASYLDEDTFDLSVNYKDGENTITIRVDVIHELPPQIFLKMKIWGRAFGQYKVPTGISVDVDMCDGKLKRYFLDSILKNIGVDMSQCPPIPGSYGIEDFVVNMDGLPSYALPGLDIQIDIEMHSPPDISLIKVKSYNHVF